MAPALVPHKGYSVKTLAAKIQKLIQSQINGQLVVEATDGTRWTLYFRVGRLFWASGGQHHFRRWRRLLKQFCRINPESIHLRDEEKSAIFEHWLLDILMKRQQLGRKEASALVALTILDVLFDILSTAHTIRTIEAEGNSAVEKEEPIAILSTAELIGQAQQQLTQWFNLGLIAYSPNLAPRIPNPAALRAQVPPKLAQALTSLATGKASIRELSVITRQPTAALGNLLIAPVQKNLVELVEIPDIPDPHSQQEQKKHQHFAERRGRGTRAAHSPQEIPTILCVDDSAQVVYILEQILQPLGYHFVSVQDPVEALSSILKYKPDLIFLDLIMPLVYGNEICTQVRRAPAFRETPIIILSGNARMLDRIQARGAGASEFMAKPLEPTKVVSTVRRYLGEAPSFSAQTA